MKIRQWLQFCHWATIQIALHVLWLPIVWNDHILIVVFILFVVVVTTSASDIGYWFSLWSVSVQLQFILNENNATDSDVDLFIVEHNLYVIKLLYI